MLLQAWLPKRHLLQYYAPPFQAAVEAGVLSMMESYSEIDGVPMAANNDLLKKLLRNEMKFEGMMVTDWAEISNLHSFHHVAKSNEDAVWLSMNKTSIDMSMVPEDTEFATSLVQLVESGRIPGGCATGTSLGRSRPTDSCSRALRAHRFICRNDLLHRFTVSGSSLALQLSV